MLMNDKIIFDNYCCINFSETKEIMVHYILQPHHIFKRVKVLRDVRLTSISKSHALTACVHVNCNINAWLPLIK